MTENNGKTNGRAKRKIAGPKPKKKSKRSKASSKKRGASGTSKGAPGAAATARRIADNKTKFLEALQDYPLSSGRAAKSAGIGRTTVYRWRESDQVFAERWSDIVESCLDELEGAMLIRGLMDDTNAATRVLGARRRKLYGQVQGGGDQAALAGVKIVSVVINDRDELKAFQASQVIDAPVPEDLRDLLEEK